LNLYGAFPRHRGLAPTSGAPREAASERFHSANIDKIIALNPNLVLPFFDRQADLVTDLGSACRLRGRRLGWLGLCSLISSAPPIKLARRPEILLCKPRQPRKHPDADHIRPGARRVCPP
jgi:hypothetical protein